MPGSKPDIAGMVNDPQFKGMSPADQRGALRELTGDDDFLSLSDGDTLKFVSQFGAVNAPRIPKPTVDMRQVDFTGAQLDPNNPGTGGLPGMTGNRPVTGADLVPGAVAGGAAALAAAPSVIGAAPLIALTKNALKAAGFGAGAEGARELYKLVRGKAK